MEELLEPLKPFVCNHNRTGEGSKVMLRILPGNRHHKRVRQYGRCGIYSVSLLVAVP